MPLLPVIEKGRSLLKAEKVSYTPWTRSHAEKREVKLALANLKTGAVRIVSGWTRGENLFLNDRDIVFDIEWWNGFNSAINILKPEHTAVVAMLYALEPERQQIFQQKSHPLYALFKRAHAAGGGGGRKNLSAGKDSQRPAGAETYRARRHSPEGLLPAARPLPRKIILR